jgi:hypothetical protein
VAEASAGLSLIGAKIGLRVVRDDNAEFTASLRDKCRDDYEEKAIRIPIFEICGNLLLILARVSRAYLKML